MELCRNCSNPVKKKGRIFCSPRCVGIFYGLIRSTKVIKICHMCGKEYKVLHWRKDVSKYCSHKCQFNAIHQNQKKDIVARLESYYYPEPNTGCFIWTGAVDKQGRGYISFGGKTYKAHKLMFQLEFGYLPKDKLLHHICHHSFCGNPRHLLPVSNVQHYKLEPKKQIHALKWQEASAKAKREKQSCFRGHLYTVDNTYITPKRTRVCKTCQKESIERFYKKQKQNNIKNIYHDRTTSIISDME